MTVRIVELPLDYGANRRGSDMGPSAIRLAGLRAALDRIGIASEESLPLISVPPQEYVESGSRELRYMAPIARACGELARRVETAVDEERFPLVLGGDHSIAIGTLAGLGAAAKKRGKRLGVLWVDAHGDFNTASTSPSGNIHGMSLAVSCGLGHGDLTLLHGAYRKVDPENVAIIGARDLDPHEKSNLREAGVTVITMTDVDREGIEDAVERLIAFFRSRVDMLHVSVDMDVMDPMYAPGVGIPLPGGFTYREILFLCEELAKSGLLASAEIVEVNPVLDIRNQTAEMAVEIITRLLGGTIY